MSKPVEYQLQDSIATITLDDGKVNALTVDVLRQLDGALDRARADRAAVVLGGRPGTFSAGFDLRVLGGGERSDATTLAQLGFELAERIFAFPAPVVAACSGHAIAMGAFLLLAADYRLGVAGPYRIGANEVAIGITMPFFGVEICRQRLAPAHFHRAVIQAEIYAPEEAVAAGFLDHVVSGPELVVAAREVATRLGQLDREVFAATKLRARDQALRAVRAAIEADAGVPLLAAATAAH